MDQRKQDAPPRAVITAQEVADMIGVHVQWVYKETRRGRIPHIRLGRAIRYRPESIEQWLADSERQTAQ